jgi:N utilization substance protein B
MSATDRAVLRLAATELLLVPGVPEPVTINEAVDIAKRYGGDESGGFVNGVLDAVRRRLVAHESEEADAQAAENNPAAGAPGDG